MLKLILSSLQDLISPRVCKGCGSALLKGEELLCCNCMAELPHTNMHRKNDNRIEQMFWGYIPIVHATSFLQYTHNSTVQRIMFDLKYHNEKNIGIIMGRMMATELKSSNFFDTIDYIVPVPLHKKKLKKRGYNQSEYIAKGVADITGIPLLTKAVARNRYTETQTKKNIEERMRNVTDAFTLTTDMDLDNRHILIIDDVLTTGATSIACASAFSTFPNIHFSVLTLAVASL